MKKFKFLTLIATVAVLPMLLTNCSPGETVELGPTLNFLGGSEYVDEDVSLPTGTDFTVGLVASHTSDIESLMITVSINGGTELTPAGCTLCDTTFGSKDFTVEFNGTTGNSTGTEVWSFTAADANGNATTKKITITVIDAGEELYEFEVDNGNPPQPHRVYNFIGPNKGAYQIGAGPLASADPNEWKDIQDSVSSSDGANWPGRWTSRNGSTFKKVTSYNWTTMVNTAQLEDAWTNSGTAMSVISPKKGDFYAISLPSGKYAFIEITDVVTTGSDNLDYVQFRYKFRN